jgi:hypothetical protein
VTKRDPREPAPRIVTCQWDGTLFANWWSGQDIGEQWNNMVRAIRRTGNDPRDATPRMLAIVPGAYELKTPIDLTGFAAMCTSTSVA